MTKITRRSFAKKPQPHPSLRPNLIQLQQDSFEQFVDIENGFLKQLLTEGQEITDATNSIAVHFGDMKWEKPVYTEDECKMRDATFSKALKVDVDLIFKDSGEVMSQEIFFGDIPWMTDRGTFIIAGTERVIISQIVRAPGAYIQPAKDNTRLFQASLMPAPGRGSWLDIELDRKGRIQARIDRKKRRFPITVLLSALGYSKEEVLAATDHSIYVERTYEEAGEHTLDKDAAAIEIFKKQRPGDPPSVENAHRVVHELFFDPKRYSLSEVGRYKLNRRLGSNLPLDHLTLAPEDILNLLVKFVQIPREFGFSEGEDAPEDLIVAARGKTFSSIEHLLDEYEHFSNRRVKGVGELLIEALRTGWQRSEKAMRERMTIQESENMTPQSIVNVRPLVAGIKEFFGSSQLSQFMDQDNALAGLVHRRRITSLGPGGLDRNRAPLEVRDVHPTHYGRMCPIETPEGPNIGLIGSLSSYAGINKYGFLTTPYYKVEKGVIHPDQVVWLDTDEESSYMIAPSSTNTKDNKLTDEEVIIRTNSGDYLTVSKDEVQFIDLSPDQLWSISTSLIPFLEHDDANRALMGSNMQRQSVPLLRPSTPLIGTGMESWVGRDSGEAIFAPKAGVVTYADASKVVFENTDGEQTTFDLKTWQRSNQGTFVHQQPRVRSGETVEAGQLLADGSSTEHGELALGRNLKVAFMPWEGYNFEDSIILSSEVVKNNLLTSIHIESYEVETRSAKQGNEEITRDLPSRSEESLKNLDEDGIIRVGAKVSSGSILVGRVSPKGDTEPSAEEKLIRAIFKEQAREVRDTSLKVPHGDGGVVIDVQIFRRSDGDDLPPGVQERVRVFIAQKRHIKEGDKLAGRHGNKGVVSKIVPVQDMPHLADGTPVDVILNPLGVPSRMNIGQVMETHLGWVAFHGFGKGEKEYVSTPVFEGATLEDVDNALLELHNNKPELQMVVDEKKVSGAKASGTFTLYNGRTGEPFERPVTVGIMYMLKLHHLVDDKIHARSTGPYSLITQQPLGGKAQFGGQRFGEMEVWALEAYGAAHTLQEMLTIKSDDLNGRVEAYSSIINGTNIGEPSIPESFRVLAQEMKSLGLTLDFIHEPIPEEDLQKQQAEDEEIVKSAQNLGLEMGGFFNQTNLENNND